MSVAVADLRRRLRGYAEYCEAGEWRYDLLVDVSEVGLARQDEWYGIVRADREADS